MSTTGIAWIVTVGFIALIGIGFLIGLWRGAKRSLLNLIFSIAGMVVAFFVTKPITNAIMGIKISSGGSKVSLNNYFVDLLKKNDDIKNMMTANENFNQFINGLPSALVNTVVFLLVAMAVSFVIYFIYKIVCIFVRYHKDEKKHRLIGGGVNAVKVALLSVFALMPLISLTGMVSEMAERESYITVSAEASSTPESDESVSGATKMNCMPLSTEELGQEGDTDQTPNESTEGDDLDEGEAGANNEKTNKYGYIGELLPNKVIDIIRGVNGSFLGKVCGLGGLDDKLFDYYAQVSVDGENVNVRDEVPSYYEVLALKYDIENATELNFTNIDYTRLSKVVDKIVESPLFTKVVSTTLSDMIINYKDYSFLQSLEENYGTILAKMGTSLTELADKSTYFANDLKAIVEIFKTLGENGVIDDIRNMSKEDQKDADKLLQTLTNENVKEGKKTNYEALQDSLKAFFNMNTIHDSIDEILKKYGNNLIDDLEPIGVDTSEWSEDNWIESANGIASFIKNYADLSKEIKFADVLGDATILLDKDKNYDIENILTTLGSLIDGARGINLLQTTKGKSIFDKLLSDNNIVLPADDETIKDADGKVVEINSYTTLFTFISPSLESLKSSGLYEVITGGETNKIKLIAQILSKKTGEIYVNQRLLNKIILPLNQVEPTKSLIMGNLTSSFGTSLVDLSGLDSYEEWDKDLGYISSLLIVLNSTNMPDSTTTYLDKIIDNKTNDVFDNLTDGQIDEIVKPILYAKSTTSLKTDIMNNIASEFNALTGASDTISLTGVTLAQGDSDDQADEICNILKSLILLRNESGTTIKDMDEVKVKSLLTSLQANGYRKDKTTQNGVFKSIFGSVMVKFKSELADYDTACQEKYGMTTIKKLEELCGQSDYLQDTNYGNINFETVFEKINSLKTELGVS